MVAFCGEASVRVALRIAGRPLAAARQVRAELNGWDAHRLASLADTRKKLEDGAGKTPADSVPGFGLTTEPGRTSDGRTQRPHDRVPDPDHRPDCARGE